MHTLFLLLVLSALLAPTLVVNEGSLYGFCSQRFQKRYRLLLPNRSAVGHFAQGFCGALLSPRAAGVDGRGRGALLTYPVHIFVKRLPLSRAVGINNTSFAVNLFDFLLGAWTAACVHRVLAADVKHGDRPRARSSAGGSSPRSSCSSHRRASSAVASRAWRDAERLARPNWFLPTSESCRRREMIWSFDSNVEERAYLHKALSATERSVIVTDEHERIVGVSRRWVDLCGFLPTEAFGQTPRILQGVATDLTAARLFVSQVRNGSEARVVLLNYSKTGDVFRHEIMGWQYGDLLVAVTLRVDATSLLTLPLASRPDLSTGTWYSHTHQPQ